MWLTINQLVNVQPWPLLSCFRRHKQSLIREKCLKKQVEQMYPLCNKTKNQGHKCAALYIYAFPTRPSKKHFSKATELAPPLPRYISMLKAQKWCTGLSSQLKRITWWWTLCTWLIEISMSKHLTPIRVHFHKLTWIYFQLLCSVLYSIKLCIN